MIQLHFVSDGPRDHVTIPHIVGKVLRVTIHATTFGWARLRERAGVSGYRRQVQFAIASARADGADAILATVDRDKDPQRQKIEKLMQGRTEDRASNAPFPFALGQADPHGEAWLLDDRVAVRRGLRLAGDAAIPTVRQTKSAKDALEDLLAESDRAEDAMLEVLEDIAMLVDPARFDHAAETGFRGLEREIKQELAPVAARCGDGCRCGDACTHSPGDGQGQA
jgi:hypothetical protein